MVARLGALGKALQQGLQECFAKPREFASLCALAAVAIGSYGFARPAVESLFFSHYSKEGLPKVWLAVALVAALVVYAYNRFARGASIRRLYLAASLISAGTLALLLLGLHLKLPHVAFILYIWKDIYIVVLVEIFWSFANMLYPTRTARWAYGLFCASGSLGGISAEFSVGYLARSLGTHFTLWLVVPMLVLVGVGASFIARDDLITPQERSSVGARFADGLRVLWQSKYLTPLLVLICVMQLVVTFIDYQFNGLILELFPDENERTNVIGNVYAAISASALALQLLTGPLLRFLGVGGVLVGIPMLLGGAIAAFALSPRFFSMAVAKVASKAMDYSVFRAGKELLYIPLSYGEKVQGKAIIDILAYRVAKGGASLLLLSFTALDIGDSGLNLLNVSLIVLWIALTVVIVRRYLGVRANTKEVTVAPAA